MVSEYIQIISKIVPKNNNDFKLIDVQSIDAQDYTRSCGGNILAVNVDNFQPTGFQWDFEQNVGGISGSFSTTDNIYIGGTLLQYSDIRLKKDINNITNSIDIVKQIQGVQFNWISNQKHDYGVIAQQMQKVLPESVITQKQGLKRVNYMMMIPFLIESIKQLNNKVQQLQHEIQEIKK